MANVKRWFKRLRCWAFGCELCPGILDSSLDEKTQIMTFRNRCRHCGKEYRAEVPYKALLNAQQIRLEVARGKRLR